MPSLTLPQSDHSCLGFLYYHSPPIYYHSPHVYNHSPPVYYRSPPVYNHSSPVYYHSPLYTPTVPCIQPTSPYTAQAPCTTTVTLLSLPLGPWASFDSSSTRLEPSHDSDSVPFKPLLLCLEQHLVPSRCYTDLFEWMKQCDNEFMRGEITWLLFNDCHSTLHVSIFLQLLVRVRQKPGASCPVTSVSQHPTQCHVEWTLNKCLLNEWMI